MTGIVDLNLDDCGVGCGGAMRIVSALQHVTKTQRGDDATEDVDVLPTTLRSLALGGNNLHGKQQPPMGTFPGGKPPSWTGQRLAAFCCQAACRFGCRAACRYWR